MGTVKRTSELSSFCGAGPDAPGFWSTDSSKGFSYHVCRSGATFRLATWARSYFRCHYDGDSSSSVGVHLLEATRDIREIEPESEGVQDVEEN